MIAIANACELSSSSDFDHLMSPRPAGPGRQRAPYGAAYERTPSGPPERDSRALPNELAAIDIDALGCDLGRRDVAGFSDQHGRFLQSGRCGV